MHREQRGTGEDGGVSAPLETTQPAGVVEVEAGRGGGEGRPLTVSRRAAGQPAAEKRSAATSSATGKLKKSLKYQSQPHIPAQKACRIHADF